MQPFYIASGSARVFAVYHPAATTGNEGSSKAVVICPPFGQEAIRSHKCLLSLARRLAQSGVHVLRLAYRGTDDSSLWSDEIFSLRDWTDDIWAAKRELKRLSGCSSVMLAGLRLGGNLATEVARHSEDVHSIVLWEPINDGQEYLDSLRRNQEEMHDLWHTKLPSLDTEEIEELFSTRYQRCLLAEIETMRLDTQSLSQPVLVIATPVHSANASTAKFSRELMDKHIESVEPEGWSELDNLEVVWWRPQSVNQVVSGALEMFSRVDSLGWHRQFAHSHSNHSTGSTIDFGDITPTEDTSAGPAYEFEDSFVESVVEIGEESKCIGVLSMPLHGIEGAPVVIILNAGIVHRVGPFRLHVNIARLLAKSGFACLRIDLSGLGDSKPRTGKNTKDERVRMDVREAMDFLQSEGIGNNFVLLGLCSGAYQVHQNAVSDERVIGTISLDGIVFRTLGYYLRHHFGRLFNPRFWRNAIKRRCRKALRQGHSENQEEGRKLGEAEYFQVDKSRQEIAGDLLELKRRQTQMLFVYTGDYDDVCGQGQFREMFGIKQDDQIQVAYLSNVSHTFRIATHRDQLCRRIVSWMKDRFQLTTSRNKD